MIAIRHVRGTNCPIVMCDYCKEVIDKETGGTAAWKGIDDEGIETVRFYHKGRCAVTDRGPFEELSTFLDDLAHNTSVAEPYKANDRVQTRNFGMGFVES
jgi:hypothetical protein